MKVKLIFIIPIIMAAFCSCKNSAEAVKPLCDTTCLKDTIKFTLSHPQRPFVYITSSDCLPDSLIWSHSMLDNTRKMGFASLMEKTIHLNKSAVDCYIKDTSYAWLKFNDCATGRGFLLQLPFNKKNSINKFSSALNSFDPKFQVEEGLICYADYAFLYVEDMQTGKKEKIKLNDKELKIDFNKIHETFESVNVTRKKVTANLIIENSKKTIEKPINL